MMQRTLLAVTALTLVVLGGCSQVTPGTSRSMGGVHYEDAVDVGRQVMSQNFPLAQIDERKGLVVSQPIAVTSQQRIGGAQQRQIARLRLHREGGDVVASIAVEIQRQSAAAFRQMQRSSVAYDGASSLTPAEVEAATTAEQNEAWTAIRYNHALEARLLDQLYRKLHEVPVTTTIPSN